MNWKRTCVSLLTGGAVLTLMSGCAFSTAKAKLAYKPAGQSPLSTVTPLNVAIDVEDQRPPEEREQVGNKRNNFGSVTAKVVSVEPLPQVIANALKTELENNGHRVAAAGGPADVTVKVAVKRFFCDTKIHFWDVELVAFANGNVCVEGPSLKTSSCAFGITSTSRTSNQILTDGDYEEVLNAVLVEFVRNFALEPKLLQALGAKP